MCRARAHLTAAAIVLAVASWASPARAGELGRSDAPPEIVVSRQLMETYGLSIGDVVLLSRDAEGAAGRRFRIVGAYEPTPDPMKIALKRMEARLHLPDLLEITRRSEDPRAEGAIARINVALKDPEGAESFARDLVASMPNLVIVPTAPPERSTGTFAVLDRFHKAIAVVTLFGSTAFLLALMVMRAEERRETVGILRLVGFRKRRILLEVMIEGLLVAVGGAVFGILFAYVTEGVINRFFQWRYDTALVFVTITPGIAWLCVAVAVPLGVLAGLVTSWTLLRRDIVALLRR